MILWIHDFAGESDSIIENYWYGVSEFGSPGSDYERKMSVTNEFNIIKLIRNE